jgi:hypothetical protein
VRGGVDPERIVPVRTQEFCREFGNPGRDADSGDRVSATKK